VTTEPIPEELRRFIHTSVPSVPFVEALLLFREASERGESLSVDQIARGLYVSDRHAAAIVEELYTARIVESVGDRGAYRYAPGAQLAQHLDGLAKFYRSRLVEVTSLIHSRTGRMAQQFADAFRLRKD
jgi:hypothetical protein